MSYNIFKHSNTWFASNVNIVTRSMITAINIANLYMPSDAVVKF